MKEIQSVLEQNEAGFRSVPGTHLKNQDEEVVYTPPQNKLDIESHMHNLELFMNDDSMSDLDPLIKMAIIHHQFESIHPFYDGNGRTGRILNILYLVSKELLHLQILPVIVVDLCENQNGEKMFLLAQSNILAQQIHILKNKKSENPWYSLNELKYPLKMSAWTFKESSLRRMP